LGVVLISTLLHGTAGLAVNLVAMVSSVKAERVDVPMGRQSVQIVVCISKPIRRIVVGVEIPVQVVSFARKARALRRVQP
jgi:hypothetical protein